MDLSKHYRHLTAGTPSRTFYIKAAPLKRAPFAEYCLAECCGCFGHADKNDGVVRESGMQFFGKLTGNGPQRRGPHGVVPSEYTADEEEAAVLVIPQSEIANFAQWHVFAAEGKSEVAPGYVCCVMSRTAGLPMCDYIRHWRQSAGCKWGEKASRKPRSVPGL